MNQHIHRAINENKNWKISNSIKEHRKENFKIEIKEIVRGKSNAHKREIELIKIMNPTLNTASV